MRRVSRTRAASTLNISIHAPLAGCDIIAVRGQRGAEISIHAPLAGCDSSLVFAFSNYSHFNPRTPCGVRLHSFGLNYILIDFNPRTPCGVRHNRDTMQTCSMDFNPRTPCGVRRETIPYSKFIVKISIHAPLAGCDEILRYLFCFSAYFNPRTPCGVRRPFSEC